MRRNLLGMLVGVAVVGFSAQAMAAGELSPEVIFRNRDVNGDGKLSFEEYVGKAAGATDDKTKERFAKLDKDGDGFLSFPEFAAAPRFTKKK